MTKMSTPQMSVIRFNESDVIVASNGLGKTLTISGTYNNISNDALYVLGNGKEFNDNQVISTDSSFISDINSYLGGENFSSSLEIQLARMGKKNLINICFLFGLAANDMNTADANINYDLDGSYSWNGSSFVRQ